MLRDIWSQLEAREVNGGRGRRQGRGWKLRGEGDGGKGYFEKKETSFCANEENNNIKGVVF